MQKNKNIKSNFKKKLINFYNLNKIKIYSFSFIFIVLIVISVFIKNNNEKKNVLISEKFIQAGILLSSNKKDEAKNIFEEIILTKNSFYSILALNTLIEKKLITDKEEVLRNFKIVEKSASNQESKDLIKLKKALYLMNISEVEKGNILLKDLVDKNSTQKDIAEEILEK